MKALSDADVDASVLTGARIAIIGYGNQGHAHALNLRDSGQQVVVGLRPDSPRASAARAEGFAVLPIAEAAAGADIVMLLAPDERHPAIWRDHLAGAIRSGAALGFAHGFAIHFGLIEPPEGIDVILVAPKGPGHGLRAEYRAGRGLPCLVAVAQDASGRARDRALAYAGAIGSGRVAILETSFKDECETDLFGEQAVLCGGIPDLVIAGFETLVEAGYAPELAYFECLHEVKLIVDLMVERGIAGMREAISNTAEFGGYVTAPRLVTAEARAAMRAALADIQAGRFADAFMRDTDAGNPVIAARRRLAARHRIEEVGAKVRAMMRAPAGIEDQLPGRASG